MLNKTRRRLLDGDHPPPERAIKELERDAQRLVLQYLTKSNPLRPSAMARELKALNKQLARAAKAVERLGEDGMLRLFAASNANRSAENLDPRPHIDYFTRIALYARRAAETEQAESISAKDHEGGQSGDENLRSLVLLLMQRYQEILSIRPTHTIDPDTSYGVSDFNIFVGEALDIYNPTSTTFGLSRIKDAISLALDSRDFEEFTPPPLP